MALYVDWEEVIRKRTFIGKKYRVPFKRPPSRSEIDRLCCPIHTFELLFLDALVLEKHIYVGSFIKSFKKLKKK